MAGSENKWGLVFLFGALVIVLTQNSENQQATATASIVTDENGIIIDVPDLGKLKGSEDQTSWTKQKFVKFLGIPFAEPPINELRFKPPVPLSKWTGIKDATRFGKRCPAPIYNPVEDQDIDSSSEDCLNLCVYSKDLNANSPVMFYIHGGGLWNGTASEHPANFLLEKDIVYVAIQYRLGALGFISTQTPDIPGNMGVLDVYLALEWVYKNIKHFGGNPDDVTVFGNSAGGAITSLLTISPLIPQHLFQKAIVQSGSALMPGIYDFNPIKNARNTCKKLHCQYCDEVNEINHCLQQASVSDLLTIAQEVSSTVIAFGFTINDYVGVIPKKPKQLLFESTKVYQVMAGVMKHDGAFLLTGIDAPNNTQEYIEKMINYLGEVDDHGTISNLILKLYVQPGQLERSDIEELMPAFVDIASTILFKSPVQKYIELYNKKHSNQNNYLYTMYHLGEMHYIPEIELIQKILPYYPFVGGVHHADELLYLFPTKNLNDDDTEMAKKMIDLWTSFAINGKPVTKNSPAIQPIKNGRGPYFRINKKITIADDFSDEFVVSVNEKF